MTNQNSKQKRNKIILSIVVGLIVLCLIICGVAYFGLQKTVSNMVQVDPEEGKKLAMQITDYDLPEGYKEMGGSTIMGVVTTAIADEENENNAIWLLQAPSDSLPTPEKFLRDAIAYQRNNPITWTQEDVKIYTIRGEKTAVTIYSGTTQDQQTYRAWAAKLTGKGGPALIVIVAPTETWNESVAEKFIVSMI